MGRTTGWTRGNIDGTCVNFKADEVPPETDTSRTAMYICMESVKGAYAGAGDSGSPVFVAHNDSNTEVQALGILSSVDYAQGYDLTGEGGKFCNNSDCHYFYSRLLRITKFLIESY